MSLESGNEALEVEQWSGRRNPKEEEEGVFIPTSPELAVGGSLRPGQVTRHGWSGHLPPHRTVPGDPTTRVGRPGRSAGERKPKVRARENFSE
jgi:hypothetical protein